MSRQSKGWASVLVVLAMALALVSTPAFAEAVDGADEVLEQVELVEEQTEVPTAEEAVEPTVELQSAEVPEQGDAFVIHKGVPSMYGSIFDAVLAAVDGDTVSFARDQTVTLTEDNAMVIDKDITIDINGKTVEFVRENPYGSVLAPFEIKANVSVTGSGRFVSHAPYGFCVTGDGFLTVDGGDNLTIVGDSAIGSLFRLDEFNTSVEPPRVVIKNGRFEAIYSSAAHPSIWVQSGYLDIRGGSFGGNSLQGNEMAGASISLEMPEGLSISGGTFEYGIRSEYSYTNAGRFITGGTFRTDLPPEKLEDYIAPGYLQDSSGQIVPYAGGLSIKVNNNSKPYNGQAQKPDITVTRNGDGKDVSDDMVYDWEGGIVPVKAGTYSLTLRYGPREFGGYNFTIEPLNLSQCTVEVENIAFTGHNEAAAKPVVKDRSGVTIPMDDYDYVSDMGVNAGDSYSVTVMPFNGEDQNVCDQQTVHFAIEPVSLDAENITWTLDPEAFLVTDVDPFEPQVTGVLNAGSTESAPYTLVPGEDYIVKYTSYALLSQASAIITASTSGNFTSANTLMIPIAQPAELPVAKTDLTYDGTEQVGIEQGVGYTIEGATGTDAGDYTAIATLEDGYAWADRTIKPKKVTWSIAKAPNDITVTASDKSVTYKTSAQTVACPLKVTGAIGKVSYTKTSGARCFSVAAETGKLTVAKGTPAGSYTIKVTATAAGDANHQSKSVTKSVKVTVKKAANTLAVKAVKSTQSVAYGKTTKIAASKVFKVAKNVSKGKVTYKKASGKASITVSSTGKVTVKRGLAKGTYTVKVKVTAAATKNYKSASQTVTLKVRVK